MHLEAEARFIFAILFGTLRLRSGQAQGPEVVPFPVFSTVGLTEQITRVRAQFWPGDEKLPEGLLLVPVG